MALANLMEIAPAGTPDPSASLCNTTMFPMAGLLAVAFVANALVRPVHESHPMGDEEQPPSAARCRTLTNSLQSPDSALTLASAG